MKHFLLAAVFLCETFLHASTRCSAPTSEFQLDGNFLIGGLFDIHYAWGLGRHLRPEAVDCSTQCFSISNYRRFQLMRFAVEEINNSTRLLPNVTLGYEMFDHCSDTLSFPGILKLISVNGRIQPWAEPNAKLSKVIAVVGPFTSTQALTVAPLFMVDLIPMVNYGSSTSIFSEKAKFPSFLRTVHLNSDVIEVIVTILQHFKWRWVAFLYTTNDYGSDGLASFVNRIRDTDICIGYTNDLNGEIDFSRLFKHIELLRIRVIIVFASEMAAKVLIKSAIHFNISNKVWIANDAWSLNKQLPKMEKIQNIGTVLGVAQPIVTVPGFGNFIRSAKVQTECSYAGQQMCDNQVFNCSDWSAQSILEADPSYSFPVYSAVYAIAHALHKTLECEEEGCNNITVYPNMVLAALQKSNFTLLNHTIQFDKNGDFKFGLYFFVFWNRTGDAQKFGFYQFDPSVNFYINSTEIIWHTTEEVPTSLCTPECPDGYSRKQNYIHRCCFTCEICPNATYINVTEDPYNCIRCKETEWSDEGSTSCNLRLVEYIPLSDMGAVLIIVGACFLVGLSGAISVLFAFNYNTPVVRSAGGPMCFLILGCLILCSLSLFFYFGKPTKASCILRYFPFLLFFTVCLACFVVRSFQIVCIFKIAAKFPKLQRWWTKYHCQWLLVTGAFTVQALLLIISFSYDSPRPYNETLWHHDQIVLFCSLNLEATSFSFVLLGLLSCLCFIFSYMGKDLPKNYNEAKAITFCLLLLVLTWILFVTIYMLYHGKFIQTMNALAVLCSLYSVLLWYFLPKCYIIIFQSHKNTPQYFQCLIQNYTKTISK
ncbi:taste receptor type 1 member 1-like [Poeciliopsis prolifica]|uniref:taste receptor type 1 member 1-like n=1 Tax=Poeciliopsis prolifica TaxID=188132 RepID=UPI002413A585|nr:taste receptor type 1 member 1-like [Poeciliopsis prolifica]